MGMDLPVSSALGRVLPVLRAKRACARSSASPREDGELRKAGRPSWLFESACEDSPALFLE